MRQSTLEGSRPTVSTQTLTFKIATEEWEFEQIHRLNYKTFVEEIPQHDRNSIGTLVDKFHSENTYIICLRGQQLLGMVAARDKRPFSLDHKLPDLDSYLPERRSICEVRLLAVGAGERKGRVFKGLLTTLARYCRSEGYDLGIISGAVKQLKLYENMGFKPFGPLVGTPDALFQPMHMDIAKSWGEFEPRIFRQRKARNDEKPVNLLPGPVDVTDQVREAFHGAAVSHRSRAFVEDFNRTQRALCRLVGARQVDLLMGSGTLANDVIAGQLSLISGRGLVLSNGEFGDRLVDHASRSRLRFAKHQMRWGSVFDRASIERAIDDSPGIAWLWAAHCETSTGVLNDMTMLKEVCDERKIRLCLDCISAIGTVPVDLEGVYLASGVSGKGLRAYPGLSMVFSDHEFVPAPEALPRYLDPGLHLAKSGVPFTVSSNLVYALQAALRQFESEDAFGRIADISAWLRGELTERGFQIVSPDSHASPAVITIELAEEVSSGEAGRLLEDAGYLLSYNSDYLLQRNWIQVCLMGGCSRETLLALLDRMLEILDQADGRR